MHYNILEYLKMPDFENIINSINAIFKLIFGDKTPSWLLPMVGWSLLIIGVACSIWGIMFVLSKIKDLWTQNFQPLFYNEEKRLRGRQRRNFAGYIK
jgi:hypothetical protein